MIVFDLKCAGHHVFEAWFGSSAAYEDQRARALIACPICGDSDVIKAVMAPNVAAKGNSLAKTTPSPEIAKQAMRMLAEAQAKTIEKSMWVGSAFADQARAMHVGEQAKAPIHGQATLPEVKALVEDGVPIAPLPLPIVAPETLN